MQRVSRRLRLGIFRLRRLGKIRTTSIVLLLALVVTCHIIAACYFVDVQPGDSKLYIQLARNIIEQGVFSAESSAPYVPTLIRTPGYPLFISGIYAIFGIGNETAVRVCQALIYTLTCFIAALIAWNWVDDRERKKRAALATFILTAFCPFTVIYSAAILAETITIFLMSATILAATFAFKLRKQKRARIWGPLPDRLPVQMFYFAPMPDYLRLE